VLAEAAGFALLAAISPTALLVMAVFLGSHSPRRTAMFYVAGAVLMTVLMAVAVLVVLRSTGLNQPRQREPRYGLRLGLGVLALVVAAVMTIRGRRARFVTGSPSVAGSTAGEGKPSLMTRLTARPRPLTAFLAGLLLFAPSATFIAAVQVIATADAPVTVTALAVVIVTVITVLIVWLPLIAYLARPEATTRALRHANAWLVAHGRSVVTCCLLIAGVILVVNGAMNI
jgi:hypothetical protein